MLEVLEPETIGFGVGESVKLGPDKLVEGTMGIDVPVGATLIAGPLADEETTGCAEDGGTGRLVAEFDGPTMIRNSSKVKVWKPPRLTVKITSTLLPGVHVVGTLMERMLLLAAGREIHVTEGMVVKLATLPPKVNNSPRSTLIDCPTVSVKEADGIDGAAPEVLLTPGTVCVPRTDEPEGRTFVIEGGTDTPPETEFVGII